MAEAEEEANYNNLDHYCVDLQQKIGQGMFGIVYWGVDKPRGELVAVKECQIESQELLASAMMETQALQAIHHENVLRLRTVICRPEAFWMVMDFCDMGQLDDFFKKQHPVHEHVQVELMTQAHRALTFMHAQPNKIIHRDIKPANVLVAMSGNQRPTVKVTDFGLAKIAELSGYAQKSMLTCSKAAGNLAYMAPEMLSQKSYNEKVDVFSLGLLFLSVVQFSEGEPMFPKPDPGPAAIPGVTIGQLLVMGATLSIAGEKADDSDIQKAVKTLIREMSCADPATRISSVASSVKMEALFETVKDKLPAPPDPPQVKIPASIKKILAADLQGLSSLSEKAKPVASPEGDGKNNEVLTNSSKVNGYLKNLLKDVIVPKEKGKESDKLQSKQIHEWCDWQFLTLQYKEGEHLYVLRDEVVIELRPYSNGWFTYSVDGVAAKMFSAGPGAWMDREEDHFKERVRGAKRVQAEASRNLKNQLFSNGKSQDIHAGVSWRITRATRDTVHVMNETTTQQAIILQQDVRGFEFKTVEGKVFRKVSRQ